MPRRLREIALDIKGNWPRPYFGAVPYINAMLQLGTIHDMYGAESGKTIVLYFLANAGTWRGEAARKVKAELKEMIK
jgi:hypothetical protein